MIIFVIILNLFLLPLIIVCRVISFVLEKADDIINTVGYRLTRWQIKVDIWYNRRKYQRAKKKG